MRKVLLAICCLPGFLWAQPADSLLHALSDRSLSEQRSFEICLEILESTTDQFVPFADHSPEAVDSIMLPAAKWVVQAGDTQLLFNWQKALIRFYFKSNQMHRAAKLGHLLLEDNRFPRDPELYILLSEIYKFLGYYPEYLQLIPEKYVVLRAANHSNSTRYQELGDMASVYFNMKQYAKARSYYLQSMAEMEKEVSALTRSSYLNNIALTYARNQQADSAQYYFAEALIMLAPSAKTDSYEAHFQNVIEANRAELGLDVGDFDPLIEALKREVISGKEQHEQHIYLDGLNKLGQVYYLKKEYEQALDYLDQSLPEIVELDHSSLLTFNLLWRARIQLALGDLSGADRSFAWKQRVEDSLEIVKARGQLEMATVLLETREKEAEIQEQKLKIAETKGALAIETQEKLQWAIVSLVLLVLLVVSYLLFQRVRQKKKAVSAALEQRELLLKELHHRVKNNLQIVASLLSSQEGRSDDPKFRTVMQEGQARIQSIATVHEKLLTSSNQDQVDLPDYLADLAQQIVQAHQQADRPIHLDLRIPNLALNMDTTVPLGLIFNELLTNCYKYAFSRAKEGRVEVTLKELGADQYKLTFSDNGRGLPADFNLHKIGSFGLTLVKGLAWQLNGKLDVESSAAGTTIHVSFNAVANP